MANSTINLYAGNNTLDIEIQGLRDRSTNNYINDATVTAIIKDEDGVNITGETWPVTLSYVAASNGNYLGQVSHNSVIVTGERYQILVNAVDSLSNEGEWIESTVAKSRRFSL